MVDDSMMEALFGNLLVAVFWLVALGMLVKGVADFFGWSERKFSERRLGTFILQNLASLIRLNLPLRKGLEAVGEDLGHEARDSIADVRKSLDKGGLLGDALAGPEGASRLVSPAEAEALRVGEMTGQLEGVIALALRERMRQDDRRLRVHDTFWYPAMLIVVVAGVMAGISFSILPKFEKMFQEFDIPLPASTRWWVGRGPDIFAVAALAAFTFLLLSSCRIIRLRPMERVKRPLADLLRRLLYHLPGVHGALRGRGMIEICRDLAMLIRIRTPADRALDVIADGTINPCLRDKVREAARACREGMPLSAALDRAGLGKRPAWFAEDAADPEALAVGLEALAEDSETGLSWSRSAESQLAVPLLIVVIGIMVGSIVIGVFLPLIKLVGAFGEY